MKASLRFPSIQDLREYLDEIGVPEETSRKISSSSTFGEFTEAQLELARNAFKAEIERSQDA
ncbi:hypothetical protein [Flaviaesturariibacter aridisoli]|uniref:Uncharacterized protein n=1 Tax=Flaviaesturariibacter aridisoli TaxID=2545761 RepID=A0A4R4E7L7_9BACT|nr:hypothetical protein [Flaviaesturariibacter aridisoli]TCZ73738.1 hypothetical protein E0486_05495 [Flaviaesturariibacter aridisoli]